MSTSRCTALATAASGVAALSQVPTLCCGDFGMSFAAWRTPHDAGALAVTLQSRYVKSLVICGAASACRCCAAAVTG